MLTSKQLLDSIMSNNSRELTSRNSREVYKEEKKEILKDTSRNDCVDDIRGEVSARPAFGQEAVASQPTAVDFVSPSWEAKGESGNVIAAPRELTSRYSGISIQHAKTAKGVKLHITLQKPEWTGTGDCQMVTAELKRYTRQSEVKACEEDSQEFRQYLRLAKEEMLTAAKEDETVRSSLCIGRLHTRGKRADWVCDSVAIAKLEDSKVVYVLLYMEGEEYEIIMNHELSNNQQGHYLSSGYHGEIKHNRRRPRLSDLPLVKFGE